MHQAMLTKQSIVLFKVKDLIEMVENKQIEHREHNQHRVRALKKYIEENLQSNLFFPPIVLNEVDGASTLHEPYYVVVEGNVRIKALHQLQQLVKEKEASEEVEEIMKGEKIRDFIEHGVVSVQLFEGLTTDIVNQLYIDFNSKGKKVALSKLISYDSRNEINQITNDVLKQHQDLQIAGVEMEKHAVIKPTNQNLISLSQLRKLIAVFIKGDLVSDVPKGSIDSRLEKDKHAAIIIEWFHLLFELHEPQSIGRYQQTILSSFPLLNAIAYYAIKDIQPLSYEDQWNEMSHRMKKLQTIDFSIHNPIWSTFEGRMSKKENLKILQNSYQNIYAIADWLKQQTEGR